MKSCSQRYRAWACHKTAQYPQISCCFNWSSPSCIGSTGWGWWHMVFWLVVSTPLKNISQLGWLFQKYGKIIVMFQTPPTSFFFQKRALLMWPTASCCRCGEGGVWPAATCWFDALVQNGLILGTSSRNQLTTEKPVRLINRLEGYFTQLYERSWLQSTGNGS